MKSKEVIDVLLSVKRREISHNEKVNKLCTNPAESIGAKAIDEAIQIISERDRYKSRAEALENALKDYALCLSCIYEPEDVCENCTYYGDGSGIDAWQFDEERFARGGDEA